jgi:hypothetical protein
VAISPPPTLPAFAIHPKVKAAAVVAAVVIAAGGLIQALGPTLPPWVLTLSPILPVLAAYLKSS